MEKAQKELMTTAEFLEIYSISISEYYKEVKKGNLKQTSRGRRKFVKRTDAEEWCKNFGD